MSTPLRGVVAAAALAVLVAAPLIHLLAGRPAAAAAPAPRQNRAHELGASPRSVLLAGLVAVRLPAPTASPADQSSPPAAPAPASVPVGRPAAAPAAAPRPLPPPPPPPAPPAVAIASAMQALINADRAAAGLPPLAWNSCLAGIAYQNAQRMAAAGFISHANGVNLDLGCGVGGHSGENVGFWSAGVNDSALNNLFMNSAPHRANILGSFGYVGTAWVVARDGKGYIAVEFD